LGNPGYSLVKEVNPTQEGGVAQKIVKSKSYLKKMGNKGKADRERREKRKGAQLGGNRARPLTGVGLGEGVTPGTVSGGEDFNGKETVLWERGWGLKK